MNCWKRRCNKAEHLVRAASYLCLLVVVSLLGTGCRAKTGPGAISIEFKSNRTPYAVGDTFNGTVALTNTSSSQNDILAYDTGWFIVDVYNFWGHCVLEYPEMNFPAMTELDFAPYETKTETVAFRLERTDTGEFPLPPIPAGLYRLHGGIDVRDSPSADLYITIE
jgi:hypothetical protein